MKQKKIKIEFGQLTQVLIEINHQQMAAYVILSLSHHQATITCGFEPRRRIIYVSLCPSARGEIVKQPRQLFYTYITPYLLTRFYAMLDFSYVYFFFFYVLRLKPLSSKAFCIIICCFSSKMSTVFPKKMLKLEKNELFQLV